MHSLTLSLRQVLVLPASRSAERGRYSCHQPSPVTNRGSGFQKTSLLLLLGTRTSSLKNHDGLSIKEDWIFSLIELFLSRLEGGPPAHGFCVVEGVGVAGSSLRRRPCGAPHLGHTWESPQSGLWHRQLCINNSFFFSFVRGRRRNEKFNLLFKIRIIIIN